MEVKKFLKSWPKCHTYLIKVKIKCSELFLLETLFVLFINGQNQQNAKNIKR